MLNKVPTSRRFAVDFSNPVAFEFMEFVNFHDSKIVVMFRQFLHTHDFSLPVVACARLHAASRLKGTLGPVLMRADLFEAACCPACGHVGKQCYCSFESYAPNTSIRRSMHTWNQFSSAFLRKARSGTIKIRMTAVLPGLRQICVMDDEVPVFNVLQKGDTEYMRLMKRKAVHGLGITVIMPRADTLMMAQSVERDFIDLHNSYVVRKRIRDSDSQELAGALLDHVVADHPFSLDLSLAENTFPAARNGATKSDSLESVDEMLSIFPKIFSTATSPHYPFHAVGNKLLSLERSSSPLLPDLDDMMQPFSAGPDPKFTSHELQGAAFPTSNTSQSTLQACTRDDIVNDIEQILSSQVSRTKPAEVMPEMHAQLGLPQSLRETEAVFAEAVEAKKAAEVGIAEMEPDNGTGKQEAMPESSARTRKKAKTTAKRSKKSTGSENCVVDDDKKHACAACESRFKMRGDLLRHVKIVHEGKKMYTCGTCNKSFGHSGHLNRHISSVHLQQRRFKCQYCGFQFFQASHLQSHIRHIHAQKAFGCEECGFRGSSEEELKIHIADVHMERNSAARCTINGCGQSFAYQNDLAVHMVVAHINSSGIPTADAPVVSLPR